MRIVLIALVMLAVAGSARAFMLIGGHGSAPVSGCAVQVGGPVSIVGPVAICGVPITPACSNSLNFAQACNSQYIPVIMP